VPKDPREAVRLKENATAVWPEEEISVAVGTMVGRGAILLEGL
jgi:hypothetical protein